NSMKRRALVFAGVMIAAGAAAIWAFWIHGNDVPAGVDATFAATAEASPDLARRISFNHHVQPILSANCYACHGPDANTREAGLRLDRREFALTPGESGEPVILENNIEASPILTRLLSTDPTEVMPPPEAHSQLKPDERALLVEWVKQGAVYEEHWALTPPVKAEPPELENDSWSRTEIDRFVLD